MTRLELIKVAAGRRQVLAARFEERAAVVVEPKKEPHPMGRTPNCPRCRAGWELEYGRHSVRRSSRGIAWCETCRWWVPYRGERFEGHFLRGKGPRKHCPGSGKTIPEDR